MRCTFCGHNDSRVIDSRPLDDGASIRRRRECTLCQKRFTTYEKVEELPLVVVKKDDSREVFDSSKILNGLIKACDKRPIPYHILENMVEEIEKDIRNELDKEVKSSYIGEVVMKRLRYVDEVAYVRFASVYRKFKDISTFIDEIERLQQEKEEAINNNSHNNK